MPRALASRATMMGAFSARRRDELARRDILARGRGGLLEGAAKFGVGLGVSALDPINLASAFVPVVGQARWLAALRATAGLTRFGARAGLGAIEGAVGAALVEPIVYGVAKQEQADYGAVDSMLNLAFGAALGGGLHSLGGAIGDKLGWTRIAREELAARGRVPGALDTAARVLHPERERAARTALSQLADGRPVDVTGALDADDGFARWKMGDPWPAEIEEARARPPSPRRIPS